MGHDKVLDQTGARISDLETSGVNTGARETLAVDGVFTTGIAAGSGFYAVKSVGATTNTQQFISTNVAGAVTVSALGTNINFSTVVDTAAKVNVYLVGGILTIQNKLAAETTITVVAFK